MVAAATTGSFSVYYSPNCQNAFRKYSTTGTLAEQWINDTYNSNSGKSGFGQKVAWNAASVFVVNGSVDIRFAPTSDYTFTSTFTSAGGQCFNFAQGIYETERNKNFSFSLRKLR